MVQEIQNSQGYGYRSDDVLTFTDPHANTTNTTEVVVNALVSESVQQVAVGYKAGEDLTEGTGNTLLGAQAGQNFTIGDNNSSVGYNSLGANQSGSDNVAFGYKALNTSTHSYNTAIGSSAGYQTTSGQYNFFLGTSAGYENTTSSENIYIGREAGRYKQTGSSGSGRNVVIGSSAFRNGDSSPGTGAGTSEINTAYENVVIGYNAMSGNLGASVVACTANQNTIVGTKAGSMNLSGDFNVMIGDEAGSQLTTANYSMFLGASSGGASGASALTGDNNLCIGYSAGYDIEAGCSKSLFIGNYAGFSMTAYGLGNTAIGYEAQYTNNTSYRNTAIGYKALYTHNAGDVVNGYNTMIGYQAGDGITTGLQNTGIGTDVAFDVDANNQICIGYQATTSALNSVKIGNSSIANANIQVDWTIDSDKRIKKDIEDNTLGLSFINDLKPKKYKKLHPADWDKEIREKRYEDGVRDEFDDKKVWDGLIAQEVKEAIEKSGTSFSGWSKDANSKQGIQYSALVVPLINAVQELSKEVNKLKRELK